jgi:hypothetical protein
MQAAPPPAQSAVAPPPGPGGGKTGLIVAALVGVLVLAGGGFAAWWFLLRGPAPLPTDIGKLPDDTVSIERVALGDALKVGLRIDDVPEEAYWSRFAEEMCGGADVFRTLMESHDEFGRGRAAEALADKDEVKATLACGKAVAEAVSRRAAVYTVRFKDGKERRRVTLLPLGLDELPESTKRMKDAKKEPDNLEKVKCLKKEGADEDKEKLDKDEDSDSKKKGEGCELLIGKIQKESLWVIGSEEDVRAFASDFSAEGKNKPEAMEEIVSLAKSLDGLAVQVGTGETFSGALSAPGAVVKDEDVTKALEKAQKGVKAWGISDKDVEGFRSTRAEYHCDGDSDAEDLEKALTKYQKEAKSAAKEALEEAKEKKDKDDEKKKDKDKDKDKPKELVKWEEARRSASVRALGEAKIERNGKVVTVTTTQVPEDSEKEAFAEYKKWRAERAEKAAAIVRKLAEGEKPGKDDLEAIGGKKLLEAIDPPEFVELEALANFKIPGGGTCSELGDPTDKSCRYKKLTTEEALKKMREENEKNGWTFTKQQYSDSFYDVEKGSVKLELFLMGKDKASFSVKKK